MACLGLTPDPAQRSLRGITETEPVTGLEHVTVVASRTFTECSKNSRENIFCYGLDEQAGKSCGSWISLSSLPGVGKEEGMRRLTRETCDELVRIPTAAGFSTLNVATAFAISAYEVRRQRCWQKTVNTLLVDTLLAQKPLIRLHVDTLIRLEQEERHCRCAFHASTCNV
jgi:hypothetical protein